MDQVRGCIVCGQPGIVAYEKNFDSALLNEYTYASRKIPEFMHYEYLECTSCQILFSSELPAENDLLEAYNSASFDSALESKYAAITYKRALKRILGGEVESVLDVGCGDGEFLAECIDSGITRVQGIEPSPAASRLARSDVSERIFSGGYEEFRSEESYDLVTLFQTIEHIRDPAAFLTAAQGFSHQGGYVAVACHDYRALVNRMLRDRSPIFDIEHLQVFSPKGIAAAMQAAGLDVVQVRSYTNVYPLSYWLRLSPLPTWLKQSKLCTNGLTRRLSTRLPVGNLMAIGRIG